MGSKDGLVFPDDIAAEFLQRLPVKSIFKFKCVSKGWRDLISHPSFGKRYQSQPSNKSVASGFLFHYPNEDYYASKDGADMPVTGPVKLISISEEENGGEQTSFDFMDKLGCTIASAEGLFLVSPDYVTYYVCDPLTKKHDQLPKALEIHPYVVVGFVCKEVTHESSLSMCYTVVRCGVYIYKPTYKPSETHMIEIYSSDTGKWTKSMITARSKFSFTSESTAKVIRGALHWQELGGLRIVVYDPYDSSGHVRLIELPLNAFEINNDEGYIYTTRDIWGTQDGYLQFIRSSLVDIEVFILDDTHNKDMIGYTEWRLTHKISCTSLGFDPLEYVRIMGASPLNPQMWFLQTEDTIFSYDKKSGKMEKIFSYDFQCFPYEYVYYQHPTWPRLC